MAESDSRAHSGTRQQLELPFSRFSIEEIRRVVIEKGVVEAISVTTLWEWLHEDGLRPWTHRP